MCLKSTEVEKIKQDILKNDINNKRTILKLFEHTHTYIYDKCDKNDYIDEIIKAEQQFFKKLTKEQQAEYDKIDMIKEKRQLDINKRIFVYSYSIASKLLLEAIDKI